MAFRMGVMFMGQIIIARTDIMQIILPPIR